jgi:hypothetical protein
MAKKIRVENNEVVECMNVNEIPEGAMDTGDWRDAVEVPPTLVEGRQIRGAHWFDLSKTPVEIRWNVFDLSVSERKNSLISHLKDDTQGTIYQVLGETEDEVQAAQSIVESLLTRQRIKQEIEALQTHEEIDTYLQNNPL